MTNSKNLKKALFMSLLSIVLCVSMLIGSTLAWFTDTATTGVNKIVSGNLDVTLEYSKDMSKWNNAEGATDVFSNAKWEPGYTEVVYFKVVNKGTLAAKFKVGTNLKENKLGVNVKGETIDLTKYIKFGIVEAPESAFADREAAIAAVEAHVNFGTLYTPQNDLLAGDGTEESAKIFAMVAWMPTDVGNEANHNGINAPEINFGIEVFATQLESESDSFDNKYDEPAKLPEEVQVPVTPTNPETGATKEEQTIKLNSGSLYIPAGTILKNANGDTPNTLVFRIENAPANGNLVAAGVGETDRHFNISLTDENGSLVTSDVDLTVTLNAGVVEGDYQLYHKGTPIVSTISEGIVTFTTKSFSPFTVREYWYKTNADNSKTYLIDTVDELFLFASMVNNGTTTFKGDTVKLLKSLDLAGKTWTPVGNVSAYPSVTFAGTFEGKGNTISNMNAVGTETSGFFGSITGVVKELYIDNAIVTSNHYAGGIAGFSSANVGMEIFACKVTNSTITSTVERIGEGYDNGDKAGGIIGYMVAGDKVDGCTVENVTITAYRDLGSIVGCAAGTVYKNNAKDATLIQNLENGYKSEIPTTIDKIVGRQEEGYVDQKNNNATNVTIEKHLPISTAEELFAFASAVNGGNTCAGFTVKLTNDIDLRNAAWTPIGQTGATEFKGVFDGQNYTIYNLNIDSSEQIGASYSSGLFGWIESHDNEGVTVKNVKVDGATVTGHHNVAVIVGYVYGTIENCHVTNAILSCTNANEDANGDKCGTIAGYVGEDAVIKGCTATKSSISAGRDAGQIVGAAKTACVTDCSATEVTVTSNSTGTDANINESVIGRVLG